MALFQFKNQSVRYEVHSMDATGDVLFIFDETGGEPHPKMDLQDGIGGLCNVYFVESGEVLKNGEATENAEFLGDLFETLGLSSCILVGYKGAGGLLKSLIENYSQQISKVALIENSDLGVSQAIKSHFKGKTIELRNGDGPGKLLGFFQS